MNISLLLGAGFSFNAGLPLVTGVSEKFLQRPLSDHILNFSSGEWKWREFAEGADLHNGILGNNQIPVSMIIEEMSRHFLADHKTDVLNYEEFYQYMLDMEKDKFESIVSEAQHAYDLKYKFREFNFDNIPDSEIFSCFYHLVGDLLWVRRPFAALEQDYAPYIALFTDSDHTLNIFTLNHDLLLETIFTHTDLMYSDGFSTSTGHLVDDNQVPLRIFDGTFKERISLFKLHGSIDTYQYQYIEEKNRRLEFDYFKTLDFYAKQTAIHIEAGEVIQNWTPDITPRFITGQNKQRIIAEDKMYGDLYSKLQYILPNSDRLIVVGYSFMDAHINKVIESSLSSIKQIIHINPSLKFKFAHSNIKEINPREQAIKF